MSSSSDAQALSEWVAAVATELGLPAGLDAPELIDVILDLTADVAHGVSRPGAPVAAFLLGVAAGRVADPAAAARSHAPRISGLAATWPS